MARKIDDARIGIRETKDYATIKHPTQYVNGLPYLKGNTVPTTWYFGSKKQFFVYIPSRMSLLTPELIAELHAVVGEPKKADIATKTDAKPVVEKAVTEIVPVIEVTTNTTE